MKRSLRISRRITVVLFLGVLMFLGADVFGQNNEIIAQSEYIATEANHLQMQDIDGNVYKTVNIGEQCWMAENLRTSRYANGDTIPNVADSDQWKNMTTGAYAWLNNMRSYDLRYGKLYNWYTATDKRNICPKGWHIPSDEEWTILEVELGMVEKDTDKEHRGKDQNIGGKMKATSGWDSPNMGATNESGFAGLPGGVYWSIGSFARGPYLGYWWTSTEKGSKRGVHRSLYSKRTSIFRYRNKKATGMSCRCIKD